MQKQIKTLLTWILNNRSDLTQLQPSCSNIILNLAVIYAKLKKIDCEALRRSHGRFFYSVYFNKRLSAHHHFYQNFSSRFLAKKVMCTQTFVKKYKRKILKTWDFVQNFLCKKFNCHSQKFLLLEPAKSRFIFFRCQNSDPIFLKRFLEPFTKIF